MVAAGAKCDGGDVPSCKQAAELAMTGWGTFFLASRTGTWARKACEKKDARSCFLAGAADRMASGKGAAALFKKACTLGDQDGCLRYAMSAEGEKLPDAAAKKLFGGKTTIDLVDAACKAQRGDACRSMMRRLEKGMRPWRALCTMLETCKSDGGGCFDGSLLQQLGDWPVDDVMKAEMHCHFDNASSIAGAHALIACKAGQPLCHRATFDDMPLADQARLLRDECVTHHEARACLRLAGKLEGAPGHAGVPEVVIARLVAQSSGQGWRGEMEDDAVMASGGDSGEKAMKTEDVKRLLSAGTEPQDAVWLRVLGSEMLRYEIRDCEQYGIKGAAMAQQLPLCGSALPALRTLDPAYADDILKRYCKLLVAPSKICDGVLRPAK